VAVFVALDCDTAESQAPDLADCTPAVLLQPLGVCVRRGLLACLLAGEWSAPMSWDYLQQSECSHPFPVRHLQLASAISGEYALVSKKNKNQRGLVWPIHLASMRSWSGT
jgi:hypothetical protein